MNSSKELAKRKRWRSRRRESKLQVVKFVCLFGCVSIFTIVQGFISIPHANTVLADYSKALILSKETYSNKQKTPPSRPRPSRINTCLENVEMSDRHQTVPDPHPPCTIIISNQALLSFTDPLTRAKKQCQQCHHDEDICHQ